MLGFAQLPFLPFSRCYFHMFHIFQTELSIHGSSYWKLQFDCPCRLPVFLASCVRGLFAWTGSGVVIRGCPTFQLASQSRANSNYPVASSGDDIFLWSIFTERRAMKLFWSLQLAQDIADNHFPCFFFGICPTIFRLSVAGVSSLLLKSCAQCKVWWLLFCRSVWPFTPVMESPRLWKIAIEELCCYGSVMTRQELGKALMHVFFFQSWSHFQRQLQLVVFAKHFVTYVFLFEIEILLSIFHWSMASSWGTGYVYAAFGGRC